MSTNALKKKLISLKNLLVLRIFYLKERFISVKRFIILQILPYKRIFYTVMIFLAVVFLYFGLVRASWTCLLAILLFEKEVNVSFQNYLTILEKDRETLKMHWHKNFRELTIFLRVNYIGVCLLILYIFNWRPVTDSLEDFLCLPQGPVNILYVWIFLLLVIQTSVSIIIIHFYNFPINKIWTMTAGQLTKNVVFGTAVAHGIAYWPIGEPPWAMNYLNINSPFGLGCGWDNGVAYGMKHLLRMALGSDLDLSTIVDKDNMLCPERMRALSLLHEDRVRARVPATMLPFLGLDAKVEVATVVGKVDITFPGKQS